jgi:hypothetical protein
MSRALPLLPLLVACAGAGGAAKTADTAAGSAGPEAALAALHGQVIDPTLDGAALSFGVEAPEGCAVELELWTADGLAWPLATFTADGGPAPVAWDGRLGGALAAPQRLELAALTDCGAAGRGLSRLPLAAVRLVPGQIALDAGAGAVPLSFAKADLVTPVEVPVDGAAYQLAGGVASDGALVVPPWDQPQAPPWPSGGDPGAVDRNLPTAAVAGSALTLRVTPAAAGPDGGPLVPDGVVVALTAPVAGGWEGPVAGGLAPVPPTAGVERRALAWAWSACVDDGGGCDPAPVPGARETTHELYRLLGPSGLRDGRAEGYASDRPFIGALAATAAAVDGAADGPALMTALRGQLYTDPWVIYDPNVAAYSEYDGSYIYWDAITSELTAWLDRDQGLRLYCHSMSCLLSTLGNTWGVDARQLVLGVGFQTHLTRAAGDEDWLIWSFNSHSVATIDDGDAIWDASVDLDGDDDPGRSPVEPLAVTGLPIGEYLERLTADEIEIVNEGKCWVR